MLFNLGFIIFYYLWEECNGDGEDVSFILILDIEDVFWGSGFSFF